jgi:L-fuconolactonase
MQKTDAHQHFWRYNKSDYPWIDQRMEILKRDFLPEDLAKEREPLGYTGTIAVQARQDYNENEFLLDLAEANDSILGVVGWVDLQSQTVDEQLEKLSSEPKFCGVRHVIHDEPDDDFMLRPAFLRGISLLQYYNLTYDILIFEKHLVNTLQFIDKFPGQRFVIDHLAKPPIREGRMEPWASLITEIARRENVWCKLSGLVTEADWKSWTSANFHRYLEQAYQAFGPSRLMIGSDWPVCTLAGSYREVMQVVEEFIPPSERKGMLGQNAREFYGLEKQDQ